jgi:hypothetical protein
MSTPRSKPLEKFVAASSKCTLEVCHSLIHHDLPILITSQGASYGKCIVAEYQNVRKDMCAKEFMQLKNCYLVVSMHLAKEVAMLTTSSQAAAGRKR